MDFRINLDEEEIVMLSGEETGEEVPEEILQPEDGTASDEEPAEPEAGELLPEEETEEPAEMRLDATEPGTEAWICFLPDAGIPPEAELHVREIPADREEACRKGLAKALKCDDESCLKYTKYIEFTLTGEGKELELKAAAQTTKDEQLKLAREKFEAAERRENAARNGLGDTKLTDAAKIAKMKEIFG